MADIVSAEKRSIMMAGIRGKNTKPELLIRKALHKRGFRYRLHEKKMPGKPDIVLPKYDAVIFVHGCFWHGHDCHLFKLPSTRKEFWKNKIEGNKSVDKKVISSLRECKWRICIIWECAIKGKARMNLDMLTDLCEKWLHSGNDYMEITGRI